MIMGEVDWKGLLSGVGKGRPLTIRDSLMLYTWISQLEDVVVSGFEWAAAEKDGDADATEEARYELMIVLAGLLPEQEGQEE